MAGRVPAGTGPSPARLAESGIGVIAGAIAYSIWGLLAIYFYALKPAGAYEISGWRIVFSVPVAVILLSLVRRWGRYREVLGTRRLAGLVTLGAYFLVANWLLFVIASTSDHVVDASLGYFINPIVTVLIGVFFLRERLRPLQWAAIGIVVVGIVQMSVSLGGVPWLGLLLAITFALYGLIKHRTADRVDPLTGFAVEVTVLLPAAAAVLVVISLKLPILDSVRTGITLGNGVPWQTAAFVVSGIVTATPLLLFAEASRQLPLIYMGLLQFITPVLQFLIGLLVLHEPMPPARWVGFGLVWLALALILIDLIRIRRATDGRA